MPSGSPTAMKRPPARRGIGRAPDSAAAYGGTRGHTRLRGQLSPSGGAGTVDDPAFAESLSKKMWWPQRDSNIFLLRDRKSTRLNSSHVAISYAVFCLKKKNRQKTRFRLWRQR